LVSIHFSTDFLISNKWIDDLFEVHAIIFIDGWKFMLVINALPDPLLNSCNNTPSSALKILIIVPFVDAVAINVPSEFTAKAPTSDSCACIILSILLSTTTTYHYQIIKLSPYVRILSPPFSVCKQTIDFWIGFSAVLRPHNPKVF
jgi:hypothetical protein